MNIQTIIIAILTILLLYMIYVYFFKQSKSRVVTIHDASKTLIVPGTQLQSGPPENYTHSIWLNILDYSTHYDKKKVVLWRESSTKGGVAPMVYLDANVNNLVVAISQIGEDIIGAAECNISNIPIQTWFNVIITLNSRTLDVYFNGKLVKSCILFNGMKRPSPYKVNSPLHVCAAPLNSAGGPWVGGFSGQVANVDFYPHSVNPSEAYAIYKSNTKGINTSINLDYKIKGTLFKNGKEISSAKISL